MKKDKNVIDASTEFTLRNLKYSIEALYEYVGTHPEKREEAIKLIKDSQLKFEILALVLKAGKEPNAFFHELALSAAKPERFDK